MSPNSDPELRRAYHREWAAARRAEFMDGKTCANCGSDRSLRVVHPTAKMKSIWSRRASYREPLLAEARVLCASCQMAPERLEWCETSQVWCDGAEATRRLLRRLEQLAA